ncbi:MULTISPECIES: sugar ABC transporter ATP-binding protein [unclassified Sporosarcina]|uniref:sugar ABC transporter ATP-binding protein n=1 Tax=unclassified Sporosarcina TaxID=2647733 RepID=UPI00203DFEBC|nr:MULTISPECIES: sugar ABC transporter ATP-binding protein [unclassified Sporosarcina]GKV65938.1 monosaccharide-transporting ATPase [Sporosarcina sp. NCCP-2331]GLB56062.1 monosaccharide-transporting ATPase [Sporosarcina sp. NCCP-2378]
MDPVLLSMKNISKSFPGVKALSNVDLELRHGEVLALVGENGAGKSTMMKILNGIYSKDEGEILLEGKEVNIENINQAQELGISIIHQELNLMRDLSVAENIFIGREPRSVFNFFLKDRELNKKAADLFKRLNIELDPHTKVADLTIAKQQMVEIAKALSFNSKIIIMDEPTTALTETEIDSLFVTIESVRADGVGVIYISHRMDELKRITDRITVMRDGTYIDTLVTKETEMSKIIQLMVGRQVYIESKPTSFNKDQETILKLENVSTKEHLKDISFELKKGEILGFSGLMGAGRTEVARAIFGADKVESGSIYLNGQEVKIKSPKQAVELGIGYLSEDRKHLGLLVDMDVKTNMAMATIKNFTKGNFIVSQREMEKVAKRYVDELKIKTPTVHQKIRNLSGGNQQKVVIAKWLLRNCDILIFDEPTRGIDVGAKGEIYKLIDELAESGMAIIMISSELPEVLRMSHRVIVMSEGRITGELTSAEATQEKIMEYATAVN